MYACVHETGVGFFEGVGTPRNATAHLRDPPPSLAIRELLLELHPSSTRVVWVHAHREPWVSKGLLVSDVGKCTHQIDLRAPP